MRDNIRRLSLKLKEYISTFNLFPSVPSSTDAYELQTQRVSTRLFIIIFFASLTTLLFYNLLIEDTKTITVEQPTFSEYTHLNSTYILTCPCSKISINYGQFVHVEYTLHQVCLSSFVDQTWIKYLEYSFEKDFVDGDFRRIGSHVFQTLKAFCHLINETIVDRLTQFNTSQYVSASVVPETVFEVETKSLMNQFRLSLTNNFLLSLRMIQNTTQANNLFSALQTNYIVYITENNQVSTDERYHGDSGCATTPTYSQHQQAVIYDLDSRGRVFDVPGFYSGCYVMESLLESTLECFYDQQCTDAIQSFYPPSSTVNVTPLNEFLLREYSVNSTVKELVDNLMIEKWNAQFTFENYYNACKPIHCTYSLTKRYDLIYIATTLFGIAGGLSTVLVLVIPRLVKLIRKKKQQQQIAGINNVSYTKILWRKLKHSLRNLNFFPSKPPSNDANELRNQRVSTRLFIIIFSISLITLLVYSSLIKDTKIVRIEAPSFAQYAELNATHSDSLRCPCTNISTNYHKFLHVEYTFHQVCNSIFISRSWIHYLRYQPIYARYPGDFRITSSFAFQGLRTFCDMINRTLNDSLTRFYSNLYISASVIPQKIFDTETELLIEKFRSSLTSSFLLSYAVIRDITQANALLTAKRTNYVPRIESDEVHIFFSVGGFDHCNCAFSSSCSEISSIHGDSRKDILFNVPGFYTGCYLVEPLLQSTLQCFYDQQCINEIQRYYLSSSRMNITALNASLSRYSNDSTIKQLLDQLMIEQWNASTIFENYYNGCQPIHCTYTFETKHDLIYIFTTLFGIAGGLITILQIIVLRLVSIIMYYIRKQRRRIVPEVSVVGM